MPRFCKKARLCGLFLWLDDRCLAVIFLCEAQKSISLQIVQGASAFLSAFLYEVHAREEPQQEAGLACGGGAGAFVCLVRVNF